MQVVTNLKSYKQVVCTFNAAGMCSLDIKEVENKIRVNSRYLSAIYDDLLYYKIQKECRVSAADNKNMRVAANNVNKNCVANGGAA